MAKPLDRKPPAGTGLAPAGPQAGAQGGIGAMRIIPVALAVVAGIFAISLVLGSWYTVDEGERGVILRYGRVIGIASPGLGFKVPIIDEVVRLSVQTRIAVYEQVAAYSRDQQSADMRVSVNYRVLPDQVAEVYSRFGSEEALVARLISPRVNEETKTIFGRFNAETAIRERGRLNLEVTQAISEAVQGPVAIDGVQIENIDFSDAYEQSVEQRMLAEVEVARLRQNAEREKVQAEITITKATAAADAVRAQAQADADAIRLKGDAEAQAIRARGAALRDNPALIGLVQAERWNGVLPTTMLPGGTVPFLDVGKATAQ
jgi:regulator of protease activity HflC (stomatin/prohibitin superfamily)